MAQFAEKQNDWDATFKHWGQCRECQVVIIQDDNTTEAEAIDAFKKMNAALFGQGLACYQTKQFDSALQFFMEAAKDNDYVQGDPRAKKLIRELGGN